MVPQSVGRIEQRSLLYGLLSQGFGELARQLDAGDLGTALATEAALGALVALDVARIAGGLGGGLDERPAQVFGAVLGERTPDVAVARLAHEGAQAGIPGQLLG